MNKIFFLLLFCVFFNLPNSLKSQDVEQKISSEEASKIVGDLVLEEHWTNSFFSFQSLNLPVAMKQNIRGIEYILAVTGLEFHPTGTRMDLILCVTTPYQDDKKNKLYFSASNVSWSEKGGFADETVKLELLEDFRIPFGKKLEMVLKKGQKTNGTFAEIDCNGLKFLSVDASLIFDNSLIIPANCDTTPCKKITTDFSVKIETWSDLIVGINLPDFQIPTMPEWTFQAEQVTFDFSENRKSEQVKLPKEYIQTYFPNDENVWRGVFIHSLKVVLPECFEGTEQFSFQAQSLILDDIGVTGNLSANHVIPQGLAHIGGWGLSVDTLSLDFFANRLKSGALGGLLQLPISDTGYSYFGQIFENNKYLMQVDLNDTLQFDFLKTKSVKINDRSFVKMELVEKRFVAQAVLHGEMCLDLSLGDENSVASVKVASLGFENLIFRNREPYLSVGSLSYNGDVDFSGFSTQIEKLGFEINGKKLKLFSHLNLNLTPAKDGGFKGMSGFSIRTRLEKINTFQYRWIFDGFTIDKIRIEVDQHAFSMNGHLELTRDNKIFGNGFSGSVKFKIKQPQITVDAFAIFGKTQSFRYWYVDAMANFGKKGIPIFSGLSMNGFGGGAYQRMKPTVEKSKNAIGVNSSGMQYVPDSTVKFGIQASISVCAQSNPAVFNGECGLEMAFNTSGGLSLIQLKGVAKIAQPVSDGFMANLKKNAIQLGQLDKTTQEKMRKESEKDATITACMTLNYDFNNAVFRGLFDVKLTAPFLTGEGKSEMYLSSDKWYFHVGHPDRRCKVQIGVGKFSLNTGMYLMIGHDIPAMPRPPKEIQEFVNSNNFSLLENTRNIPAVNQGKGFLFGSDFAMNTGDLHYLIFFAQFQTRLGFDFMLKDYGMSSCAQSASPVGINGWYGSGQAYAYLAGEMGINVKVFGKKKQFTILDARVGTLLQAQLPNPSWFGGSLAAKYNILNGLIKGSCNFQFELGEKCQLQTLSEMDNIAVISDLKPSKNEKDVNVYAFPQVAFNLPVGEIQASEKENYKILMEAFTLKSGNTPLSGDLEWNEERTSVIFKPHDIFPAKTRLETAVTLSFYEKINGRWKVLLNEKNQPQKETVSHTFETGERPKTLPVSEIAYCYPVIDQQQFYIGESMEGYIQLQRDLGFLFEDKDYRYKIRFETSKGVDFSTEITYNASEKRIKWMMPTLKKQTDYIVKIVGEPREKNEQFSNVSEHYTAANLGSEGNSTEIRENKISQTATNEETFEICSYTFRTSEYATFAEATQTLKLSKAKVQSLLVEKSKGQYTNIPDACYLFANCEKSPTFDPMELFGSRYTQGKPLVKAEAVLNAQNTYFATHIHPLIYYPYNFNNMVLLSRTAGQSLLPTWAVVPQKGAGSGKFQNVPLDLRPSACLQTRFVRCSTAISRSTYTQKRYFVLQTYSHGILHCTDFRRL